MLKSCRDILLESHYDPHRIWQNTGPDNDLISWLWVWWDACSCCASCPECQLVNQPAIPKALLCPLPLMKVPSERRQRSGRLIGVSAQSQSGNMISWARTCPQKPFKTHLLSQNSNEQGTSFMSLTVWTSVYHQQTDWLSPQSQESLLHARVRFIVTRWLLPVGSSGTSGVLWEPYDPKGAATLVLRVSKSRTGGRDISCHHSSCHSPLQFEFERHTHFTLQISLKKSFCFVKLAACH